MKKLFAMLGVLSLVGFGCAAEQPAEQPAQTPSAAQPATPTIPLPAGRQGLEGGSGTPPATAAVSGLQELPAITPPAQPIDDSAWVATTTKAGVTITAPVKGSYAPTWTFAVLAKDDARLQGNCYVTAETVYERATFSNIENACQTTTAFAPGPSTRTDYFVTAGETKVYLYTFTKTYPAGFNQNEYSATLDHIFRIID